MIANSCNNFSGYSGVFSDTPYNRCSVCQHSAVCALKADYEKAFQQALAVSCKPFDLDLKCPHFLSVNQTRTFIYGSDSCCTSLECKLDSSVASLAATTDSMRAVE